MKTLILMRHSKAEPSGAVLDFDRELIPTGRKKAANFAKKLLKKGLGVDLIISSSAARAFQTAEIVANTIGYPTDAIRRDVHLYTAGVKAMIDTIKSISKARSIQSVLVVAHEPTISQAAATLLDTSSDIQQELRLGVSTANAVVLKYDEIFSAWRPGVVRKGKIIHVE